MGNFRNAERMFAGVRYNQRSVKSVREAMHRKIANVAAKIKEREERVKVLMHQHGITDAALANMLIQYMKDQERGREAMSYSNRLHPEPGVGTTSAETAKEVLVPAGVVANIITEKQLIESEGAEVKRMQFVLRYMQETEFAVNPTTGESIERPCHATLEDSEIEYLFS